MKIKLKSFVLIFTIAVLSQLNAQERVNIHFNLMLWAPFGTLPPGVPEPPEPEFWYIDGMTPAQIKAEWNVPSEPFKYVGVPNIQFYQSPGLRDGEPILKPIVSAPVPVGAKHVMFCLFQNDSGGYSVFPIDVGLQDMPRGSLKLINFSGEEIVAKVGDTTQTVPSRGEWIIPVSAAENFQLRMQLAARKDDRWKLVYRTSYAVNEDSRKILFLHLKDFTSGPYRVRPIAGFGEVEESAEEFDVEAMQEASQE